MGRHALPQPSPTGPGGELLGWGTFATLLAAALAGWVGEGWTSALPVAGLGGGATGVLWVGAHVTHVNSRRTDNTRTDNTRTAGPRHSTPTTRPRRGSRDRINRETGLKAGETGRNDEEPGTSAPPIPAQGPSRAPEPGSVVPGA